MTDDEVKEQMLKILTEHVGMSKSLDIRFLEDLAEFDEKMRASAEFSRIKEMHALFVVLWEVFGERVRSAQALIEKFSLWSVFEIFNDSNFKKDLNSVAHKNVVKHGQAIHDATIQIEALRRLYEKMSVIEEEKK